VIVIIKLEDTFERDHYPIENSGHILWLPSDNFKHRVMNH